MASPLLVADTSPLVSPRFHPRDEDEIICRQQAATNWRELPSRCQPSSATLPSIDIWIRWGTSNSQQFHINVGNTLQQLHVIIEAITLIPIKVQYLICRGMVLSELDGSATLESISILDGAVIHVLRVLPKAHQHDELILVTINIVGPNQEDSICLGLDIQNMSMYDVIDLLPQYWYKPIVLQVVIGQSYVSPAKYYEKMSYLLTPSRMMTVYLA